MSSKVRKISKHEFVNTATEHLSVFGYMPVGYEGDVISHFENDIISDGIYAGFTLLERTMQDVLNVARDSSRFAQCFDTDSDISGVGIPSECDSGRWLSFYNYEYPSFYSYTDGTDFIVLCLKTQHICQETRKIFARYDFIVPKL